MRQLLKTAALRTKALAATANPTREEVKAHLELGVALARRAEAGRAVTGGFGSGIFDTIESILTVATPLASIFGDFELSNLLGSLKVWLAKKRAEEAAEQANIYRSNDQTWNNLSYTYQF